MGKRILSTLFFIIPIFVIVTIIQFFTGFFDSFIDSMFILAGGYFIGYGAGFKDK